MPFTLQSFELLGGKHHVFFISVSLMPSMVPGNQREIKNGMFVLHSERLKQSQHTQ